jgi:hypothetical protein
MSGGCLPRRAAVPAPAAIVAGVRGTAPRAVVPQPVRPAVPFAPGRTSDPAPRRLAGAFRFSLSAPAGTPARSSGATAG